MWGFFRDSEIVILDEPASSPDGIAEMEIFTKFREIIRGSSEVLISHRFSTVLMADRIYVPEGGQITEVIPSSWYKMAGTKRCSMHWLMPIGNLRADKLRVFCTGISDLLQDKRIHHIYIASGEEYT